MRRSPRPAVALAALLVLAGCSFPGGDGTTPTLPGNTAGTPPLDVSPPYFVFQNGVSETREITIYTIEPRSNLFVALRGCAADTHLWFFHVGPGQTDLSYGPSYECPGSTILEFRNPNGGGSATDGDYRDVLAANGTQS